MTGAQLARRLGTADAVLIGVGSMVGAGVFAVWAPAARAAGNGLLIGLVLAGIVAYCNAASSAQLAAVYPLSGGTYVYGRERLGPWWGFAAGWSFLIGKTASCAAMALTFATYAVPGDEPVRRLVALAAVAGLTAVNYRGITRTARLTRILVGCSLAVLAVVVAVLLTAAEPERLTEGSTSVYGVLQSAGLLFFAFAGYARIATMGEEVRDPARTIPRAITIALVVAGSIYLLVAVALLMAWPASLVAGSPDPLAAAVDAAGQAFAVPVVRVGAALASLGALLALIAGIGRTSLAMARERDLPSWLAAVHPRYRVPHHAELAVAVVVGRTGPDHRPARRDRVLVVRRAALLRDRERLGVHATARAAPLAAGGERVRAGGLCRPRGHAAGDIGAHRCRRPAPRSGRPSRRAACPAMSGV